MGSGTGPVDFSQCLLDQSVLAPVRVLGSVEVLLDRERLRPGLEDLAGPQQGADPSPSLAQARK
jgi:hypothetical protein